MQFLTPPRLEFPHGRQAADHLWNSAPAEAAAVFEPDRYLAEDGAKDAIASSAGQDLGDELRKRAESLAYQAAKDYAQALRRIERELVAATEKDTRFSEAVRSLALDITRTHMVRGLLRAQSASGDHMTFWVQR